MFLYMCMYIYTDVCMCTHDYISIYISVYSGEDSCCSSKLRRPLVSESGPPEHSTCMPPFSTRLAMTNYETQHITTKHTVLELNTI